MKFCEECDRAMQRTTDRGTVVYRCPCGVERAGDPADARVCGADHGAESVSATFATLLKGAPFDRVNLTVRRDCAACGLDFMACVRLTQNEETFYACMCGRVERGADDVDDVVAAAPGAADSAADSAADAPGARTNPAPKA